MTYGDPQWRPWVMTEEQAAPIFQKAVEMGINFYDTGKHTMILSSVNARIINNFFFALLLDFYFDLTF